MGKEAIKARALERATGSGILEIKAEMAATVVAITCADGQPVEIGSELLILESMKMEMPVHAHRSGSVLSVCVAEGDVVQKGDTLVILA